MLRCGVDREIKFWVGNPRKSLGLEFDACHSRFLWAAVALLADWVSGQRFGFTE
jgi:hypothetical protein